MVDSSKQTHNAYKRTVMVVSMLLIMVAKGSIENGLWSTMVKNQPVSDTRRCWLMMVPNVWSWLINFDNPLMTIGWNNPKVTTASVPWVSTKSLLGTSSLLVLICESTRVPKSTLRAQFTHRFCRVLIAWTHFTIGEPHRYASIGWYTILSLLALCSILCK